MFKDKGRSTSCHRNTKTRAQDEYGLLVDDGAARDDEVIVTSLLLSASGVNYHGACHQGLINEWPQSCHSDAGSRSSLAPTSEAGGILANPTVPRYLRLFVETRNLTKALVAAPVK